MLFFGPLIILGFVDMFQSRQAIRRNFPVIGNLRYLLELIRPEIYQYFIEANTVGYSFQQAGPFSGLPAGEGRARYTSLRDTEEPIRGGV